MAQPGRDAVGGQAHPGDAIGGATGGATRCGIGGATGRAIEGAAGGVTRCPIGGAIWGGRGFLTIMRSRHLGHRMHAPFAPFSNATFRRKSVLQDSHLTTMTMALTCPPSKTCPIIGRYAVKGKDSPMPDPPMGRHIVDGCFRTFV